MKEKKRIQVKDWVKIDFVNQIRLRKTYDLKVVENKGPRIGGILRYTVKEWKRFDDEQKMWLLKNYKEIFLTDWKPKKSLGRIIWDASDPKNITKGIEVFQKYMKKMDKVWVQFDKVKGLKMIGGSRDTSFITNKSKGKKKGNILSELFGDLEPKKRKKGKKKKEKTTAQIIWGEGKSAKRNYSDLTRKKSNVWGKSKVRIGL